MPADLVPGGITVPRTLEILIFSTIGGEKSLRPQVIDHWYEGIRNVKHVFAKRNKNVLLNRLS